MGEVVGGEAWVPVGAQVSRPASRAGSSQGGLHRPSCPPPGPAGSGWREGEGKRDRKKIPLEAYSLAYTVPMCFVPSVTLQVFRAYVLSLCVSVCLPAPSPYLPPPPSRLRAFGLHGIVSLGCVFPARVQLCVCG